jgi:glycosyltransferase involved in cell wall biosynthesis
MRPHVCFVLPELDPASSTHFAHTARSLVELARHAELDVIVQRVRGTLPPAVVGARRVDIVADGGAIRRAVDLARLLVAARRRGCRHFHVHYAYSGAILAALVARASGASASYWHCGQPKRYYRARASSWRGRGARLRDELLLRLSLALVHRLVTGTARMAAYYAREFGVALARIRVVPNDVDLARFTPSAGRAGARARLGLRADRPVVLFVHRLSPRKGAHHLPAIAGRVHEAVPDAVLAVVGTGPLASWLGAEMRRRGLGDAVRLPGAVPNREVVTWYEAADVFVMPSDEEGFPRVLLEAQAMRIPFVATDVGGVLDVVTPRQAAFVAPAGATDEVADLVVRLLKDEGLRADLAVEGWTHVRRFDVARVAPELLRAITDHPTCRAAAGGDVTGAR